jgi:hypothetical protein
MIKVIIKPSTVKNKRYDAFINNSQNIYKVSFGSSDHENYTMHKDPKRKELYIKRHEKLENKYWNINGILQPSFWSFFLTWNKETLEESIKDIEQRFNIKIKLEI